VCIGGLGVNGVGTMYVFDKRWPLRRPLLGFTGDIYLVLHGVCSKILPQWY
jgi:hypothetical protein